MADYGKNYNKHHGQEVEWRNKTSIEEYDSNNIFGNNIYEDIFKKIENDLFSDEPFPALSKLPSISLSSSSSSALYWLCQLDQIHELNTQPNLDSMVQESDPFDHLDSFLLPEIPEMDRPSKLNEGSASGTAPPILFAPPPALLAPTPTYNQSDPDITRMFLDWLKLNHNSISREDLKTITLNKATVENATVRLGNTKEGKLKLVQLILGWVQEHRLGKNKPPQVKIPNCPHPYSNICGNNQMFAKPLGGYNSQPSNTQPFSSPSPPIVDQCIHSTPKEARQRRMEHLRRSSVFCQQKTNIIKPISAIESCTSTRFCKYDSKIQSLRTNWQNNLQNDVNLNLVNMHPTISNVRRSIAAFMERKKARKLTDSKFLLQKVLKQTDVGDLGRIILPKKEAEKHLPMLEEKVRLPLPMQDINSFHEWNLYYRFWPNNKSRSYVLGNTGEFVRSNGLQEGDILAIYFDPKNNRYMIEGRKIRKTMVQKEAVESCKDHGRQKISSEQKNKSIIDVDGYLIEIPSDSDDED